MNDRPAAGELIEAVRLFLEKEVLPILVDARLRFQTLVAVNVLSIAGREMSSEEAMLREEWRLLAPMLVWTEEEPAGLAELRQAVARMNASLCALIREGAFDEVARWQALAMIQRRLVQRKLEVANPRYRVASSR
jgi:hypothetical protein